MLKPPQYHDPGHYFGRYPCRDPAPDAAHNAAPMRLPGDLIEPPSGLPASAGAVRLSVAKVIVDSSLPHLDRPFDYLVPVELDAAIRVGSRVRVRFAGRLVDGWVLERVVASDHAGSLSAVQRGVGNEPVLTPETATLFRAVADRWAGSFADVMRLGVPARHARAEGPETPPAPPRVADADTSAWARYAAGRAFVEAVRSDRPARAVWNCLPDEDWAARIAELVQTTLAAGRGAIVVLPDAKDVARVERAFAAVLPKDGFVSLAASLGPEARYRRWLAVRRGSVQAVVGTRSAVYAPVHDLGLIVVFDDGDDLLSEPRGPYPHARDVAILRSSLARTALVLGGFARTCEAALLIQSGWAHELIADRTTVRRHCPRIVAAGDDYELARDRMARTVRLPASAFRAARAALDSGRPVLIQVARRGYAPTLACTRDRSPVRCSHCSGPVGVGATGSAPACRWCGRSAADWHCPLCGGAAIRAVAIGSARTAEEIGRAFPSVIVRTSDGSDVLAEIPPGASIVIATAGAEPVVAGGYGAALLLDGWALLTRQDLRASEETLRRWFNAAALTASDGTVVVGADVELAVTQALIRWDPAGYAGRELADREALDFPPVSRFASITGAATDVARLLAAARLPDTAQEIGAVPTETPRRSQADAATDGEQVRALIRVDRSHGAQLAESLHAAAATLSAKKTGRPVRIALDPVELG